MSSRNSIQTIGIGILVLIIGVGALVLMGIVLRHASEPSQQSKQAEAVQWTYTEILARFNRPYTAITLTNVNMGENDTFACGYAFDTPRPNAPGGVSRRFIVTYYGNVPDAKTTVVQIARDKLQTRLIESQCAHNKGYRSVHWKVCPGWPRATC